MVEQRVRLGGPLPVVELRPVEKGQTQRYDRGVDAEDLPFQPVGLVLAVQPFRKASAIGLEELAKQPCRTMGKAVPQIRT